MYEISILKTLRSKHFYTQ